MIYRETTVERMICRINDLEQKEAKTTNQNNDLEYKESKNNQSEQEEKGIKKKTRIG